MSEFLFDTPKLGDFSECKYTPNEVYKRKKKKLLYFHTSAQTTGSLTQGSPSCLKTVTGPLPEAAERADGGA